MKTNRVAIIGGVRIPFSKSFTHYAKCSSQELMIPVLDALVEKYKLQGKVMGDVVLGAVMTHPSDWNFARECVLSTELSPDSPGSNIQRACGTSLEGVIQIANKIALGQMEVGIAGGVDTNSDVALTINRNLSRRFIQFAKTSKKMEKIAAWKNFKFSEMKPIVPAVVEPRTKLSMGEHCELMAKEWKISNADQNTVAYKSHQNAAKAYEEGFYTDLIAGFQGMSQDSIVRADTTLEKLAKLRPCFDTSTAGTLTAGNSSSLSDGASAVLLASEDYAKANNLPILAYFSDAHTSAVDYVGGEGLLMAPTLAVSKILERNELTLQDFDFYEIHEAFAAQVLCTLKAWESDEYCQKKLGRAKALGSIDRNKMNVKGGSLALGHPFAATGSRIVATLAKILNEKGKGRGLISICTAGGMGVVAIVER